MTAYAEARLQHQRTQVSKDASGPSDFSIAEKVNFRLRMSSMLTGPTDSPLQTENGLEI